MATTDRYLCNLYVRHGKNASIVRDYLDGLIDPDYIIPAHLEQMANIIRYGITRGTSDFSGIPINYPQYFIRQ